MKSNTMVRIGALVGALLVAGSAGAQYYDPYRGDRGPPRYYDDRGPPRGYDRGYDRGFDNRGYSRRDDRRGGGRNASICLTGRGSCAVPPAPKGVSCRCDIDGLTKRGIVQ